MRIDAYTHFFPAKYFENLLASKVPDIGKRVREVPAIHDLDVRRKVIDLFPGLPADHLRRAAADLHLDAARKAEERREARERRAEGAVRQVSGPVRGLRGRGAAHRAGRGARESERAIKELGACGVQIVTNVGGKPLDRPEFEPFFARMNS